MWCSGSLDTGQEGWCDGGPLSDGQEHACPWDPGAVRIRALSGLGAEVNYLTTAQKDHTVDARITHYTGSQRREQKTEERVLRADSPGFV